MVLHAMGYLRDSRFTFTGRAGLVRVDDGVQRGVMDWEMLLGDGAGIAIYGENCRWTEPQPRKMTRDEVRQLVQEFASSVPARIELTFADSQEYMEPST